MTISYTQALDYIYSFTNYEVEPQYRYAPDVIDPTRPARLLSLWQNPHLGYPAIHIAGTKGKGSVAAICAARCAPPACEPDCTSRPISSPSLNEFR